MTGRRTDAAFEELLTARYNALLRSGYLLTGDRDSARDLVQAALTRVYARRSAVKDPAAMEQYVRRTMVSVHISWWRRHRSRETSVAATPDQAYHQEGPGERLDLWRVLQLLPAKQRTAVVLRYYEDLPIPEVARLMGCSVPTVKSHTARALARLRTALDEDPQQADLAGQTRTEA